MGKSKELITKKKLNRNIAVPFEIWRILKQASVDKDRTMSDLVSELIEEYLR